MFTEFRKSLLPFLAVLAVMIALPAGADANGTANSTNAPQATPSTRQSPHVLAFYNTHTGERAKVEHRRMGTLVSAEMAVARRIMRDHRSGESHPVEPRLLDLLVAMQGELMRRHPHKPIEIHIISGYRAAHTNAGMRSKGGGQAKNSRHTYGDAIDIRIPGIKTTEIRDVAYCLKRGGVGMYTRSDFVHVDTWNVRTWNWTPPAGLCGGDKPTS